MTETRDQIRQYIHRAVSIPIDDDQDIFDQAIVDSLFALQLVAFVEQEFSITAEPAELDVANFCSVSALTRFVERKRAPVTADGRDEPRP